MIVLLLAAAVVSYSLGPHQLAALNNWLSDNKTYRLAQDRDSSCPDDIAHVRKGYDPTVWTAVPGYHPFQVAGDFNSDGKRDFAVVLITGETQKREFALLVFNGPISERAKPAFFEPLKDMSCSGLFFGPPRAKPYVLVVGTFESEGAGLEPKGNTYQWSTSEDEYE